MCCFVRFGLSIISPLDFLVIMTFMISLRSLAADRHGGQDGVPCGLVLNTVPDELHFNHHNLVRWKLLFHS